MAGKFTCECGSTFRSFAAMIIHQARQHGFKG